MVKDYLNTLKNAGSYSWSDIANLSGIPEATVRKVFSGETADPRFDTIAKLVISMGGDMNDAMDNKKKKEIEVNSTVSLKETYEMRIADLIKSYEARIEEIKNLCDIRVADVQSSCETRIADIKEMLLNSK